MNRNPKLLAALIATAALAACERPTVVNTPPAGTVVVPAPVPGPQGPSGDAGRPGEPGKSTTIIVPAPAASEPAK